MRSLKDIHTTGAGWITEEELDWLCAEIERLQVTLKEVMEWIDNWNPSFCEDEEWPETEQKVISVLDKNKE
jgi:hypothetical protein